MNSYSKQIWKNWSTEIVAIILGVIIISIGLWSHWKIFMPPIFFIGGGVILLMGLVPLIESGIQKLYWYVKINYFTWLEVQQTTKLRWNMEYVIRIRIILAILFCLTGILTAIGEINIHTHDVYSYFYTYMFGIVCACIAKVLWPKNVKITFN